MNSYLRIVSLAAFIFVPNALAAAQAPSLQQTIVAKEREELEAIKAGDRRIFAELLADDAVFLNPRGHGDKPLVVKKTSMIRLLDFSMDDIHFVPISQSSGLVAYRLTETMAREDKQFKVEVYASAVWIPARRQVALHLQPGNPSENTTLMGDRLGGRRA
ncbi:MAG TPA: nuclear transport factor 2 family protein [Terriglobales bacterium]|nr:nuclear transport factor 2 family protein [Terriglobales bacterium]